MIDTPNANRLHISIFGKRNVGKSSLINALTNQPISVVSDTPGTTTDPVSKAMELLPLGPVVIIDTAGLDDVGDLGNLRVEKTKQIIQQTDLAVLVFSPENTNINQEKEWFNDLSKKNIPVIGVISKIDKYKSNLDTLKNDFPIDFVELSSLTKSNISGFKQALIKHAPTDFEKPTILGDIVNPKDRVILVAPQDIQAPKGRLILPQVQIIRDLLDNHAMALTVTDAELEAVLSSLKSDPDLIITDSQMFKKVNEIVPENIRLTSFSILFARYKGDLELFVKGAKAINNLVPGDDILIAEACTHHPLKGDIAREKLPLLLEKHCGGKLNISVITGPELPKDISKYKLILQCGSCMFNRKQLLSRLEIIKEHNIPVTNFGVALAELNGILNRSCDFLISK